MRSRRGNGNLTLRIGPCRPSAADLPVLESFARSNTPARQSIADWLKAVFGAESQSDGTINFSHYHQAREFDISVRAKSM